jgi:hypothetical protein
LAADLLRRAAARLRKRATRLPGAMADRPWRTVQSGSGNFDAVAACSDEVHDQRPDRACTACWDMVTPHEHAAAYVTLMHPPVALALANWLDWVAERWRPASEVKHYPARADLQDHAAQVARAILREES